MSDRAFRVCSSFEVDFLETLLQKDFSGPEKSALKLKGTGSQRGDGQMKSPLSQDFDEFMPKALKSLSNKAL